MLKLPDNRSLIKALRQDDGRMFEVVYKYYYRSLCGYAGRYVSLHDSEEIVQATMMWLWENRLALVAELSLKSLLFTIVKHKALDKMAHIRRTSTVMERVYQNSCEKYDNPDCYTGEELMKLYENALANLPSNYRTYFELSRVDGKTHAEIAAGLQVSIQTVNYNIGKALKILKRDLSDYILIAAVMVLSLGVAQ